MALKVKNLRAKVEGKVVLRGVDLVVEKGEVVVLMGPNGSGKSSLAKVLMGHPSYEVIKAKTEMGLDGEDLLVKKPNERGEMGLFLSFQYPVGLEGITVRELLLAVIRERKIKMSALELKKMVEQEAEKMGIKKELLNRSLNEGFSGGEKKKMEILQMKILKPKYVIVDEVDSGLDIDAVRVVAENLVKLAKENKTGILLITHYQRILKYLKPDKVLVMGEGKIVERGGEEVVRKLEERGYKMEKAR